MIDQEKITLDWIEKVSKANRNADRILVEKVVRALLLLEGLVKLKLPFVFKGKEENEILYQHFFVKKINNCR